jgi:hypothetical protein
MKIPDFPAHSIERKRIYILENLPAPLTRAAQHWQIFDDHTAGAGLRLRQIRLPQTGGWFRVNEKIEVFSTENGLTEEITRAVLSEEEFAGHGNHGEKELRKNRYFYDHQGREMAIDVFLANLWGLILAQVNFAGADEMERFSTPEFAVLEVSGSRFFRGENLVQASFEEVKKEFAALKR